MKQHLFQFSTLVIITATMTASGIASATTPPLEALESLSAQLANAPSVVVTPVVQRNGRVVEDLTALEAIAPTVRPTAPIAAEVSLPIPAGASAIEATPAEAAAEVQTLQARRAQETKKTAQGSVTASGLNGWLAIGLVLILMASAAVWLKRKSRPAGLPSADDIKPLAVTRLWGKHSIGLVKVSGRILVVGLGESGMSLLTELEEADVLSANLPETTSESEFSDFSASLVSRFKNLKPSNNTIDSDVSELFNRARIGGASTAIGGHLSLASKQNNPAEEVLGLSEERAAIRRRLDALRNRSLAVV